ncbi:decapping and exoribonuclease protein [Hylaeus anthracinus]|uniref:decapping and exoribonuclease protein n=1 Tax=Hylaeus anthracinus TaxID=313031 RepID=UPI0023B9AFBC|nr:decapping and exoribonuclease protein [Hylaeus anthracinus]
MYTKFKINDLTGPAKHFAKPQIVGHYSINGVREYCNDLSQLKYYIKPLDPDNVYFDLDDNHNTIYKPENEDSKLDNLLRWMSENFDQLKRQDSNNENDRWLEPEIVCFRGLLKILMITPYHKEDGWIICASKFKGTIYLCAFDTDKKKQRILKEPAHIKQWSSWGYKFEQYLLSGKPSTNPDLSLPLNQNEEFCCVFKSKLRETVLLYGAEIDGICFQQQIEDILIGKDVELIELKTVTHRAFNSKGDMLPVKGGYRAPRTLQWWCQCYLVDIKRITCGHRNDDGIVTKIKEYNLRQLASDSRDSWSHEICRNFCDQFLQKVKTIVTEDYEKCLYKFTYEPRIDSIIVHKIKPDPNFEYTFLHSWYIDKAKRHFENR